MSTIKASKHQIGFDPTPANNIVLTASNGDLLVNRGVHDGTLTEIARFSADGLAGSDVVYTPAGTGAAPTTVQSKLLETVSVTEYYANGVSGAKVDPTGVVDSTAGIQAALDYGAANGIRVVGQGTFKTSSKVVIKGDADFSQATFNVYGTPDVAVEVSTGNASDPTTQITNAVIWLPKRIINVTKPSTGWAGQGIGVRVVNAYSCQIFIGNNVGFSKGLLITSFGTGNVYNNIYLGHLENNQINLALTPGNSSAWVNENNFIGGRLSHKSAEGANVSGTRHILLSKSTHAVNNNLFIKPSVEGDTAEYHVENGGSFNTFQQARWEAATPKVLYTADSANQGSSNYIIGGYGADNIVFTYAGGIGGSNNRFTGYSVDYITVGTGQKIQNQSSSANPIHLFYEAGTRPELAASTEWSVQHGSQSLQGKRKADSYSRVNLDYQNGRLYLGDGAAAPTKYFGGIVAGSMTISSGLMPTVDNSFNLGTASYRWGTVYAATGTINTSDKREKQDVADLDDAEKRVAAALKGLVKKFRFKDAVAAKGDNARIHIGVIAQEVMSAFQAEGLDPMRYAIVCYDEWDAELDDDGNQIRPAGNRYGVRYEELLAFIIAAL